MLASVKVPDTAVVPVTPNVKVDAVANADPVPMLKLPPIEVATLAVTVVLPLVVKLVNVVETEPAID